MTLHRAWRRVHGALGLPGLAGLAALAVAATTYALGVEPLNERVADVEAAVARSEHGARTPAVAASARPADRVRALRERFPARASFNDWIETMDAAAATTGATVERFEYQPGSGAPLARHPIGLPVTGSYAQVRAYVGELLATVPTLAITDIDLQRESIAAPGVTARINTVLYLQGAER